MVGVVTVGRPVARMLCDGLTLEVTRCCTTGVPNSSSRLYAVARRVARELGYKRLVTYTLESESGHSLKASGWTHAGEAGGGSWSRVRRPRTAHDKKPECKKTRWEIAL